MLYDIPVKSYCGPAALMAITGLELPIVRAAINHAKGRRENTGIIGTSVSEMLGAVAQLGYNYDAWRYYDTPAKYAPTVTRVVDMKRPTLEWLAGALRPGAVFIVNITGHWVAMQDGIIYDNWARYGEPISESRWRRKLVQCAGVIQGRQGRAI